MRRLAQYVMRGNKQATLVAVLCAIIPILNWVGAAVMALVILRKGYQAGASVFMWSLLPTLVWWSNGNPSPAVTLIGVGALACVLRYSASWAYVLVTSIIAVTASMPILTSYLQDVMAALSEAGIQLRVNQQLPENVNEALIQSLIEGILAAGQMVTLLGCVVLARWWQAVLFNPGGFQTEFHQLRLPLWLTGTLAFAVFGLNSYTDMAQWVFMFSIPLLFAGFALVHGLVEQLKLGRIWLIAIYLGLLLTNGLVFILLALLATLDSAFNLRQRLPVRVKK